VILLLEPQRPAGFVSGGYRYQTEIAQRLAARGEGQLRALAPAQLDAVVAAAAAGTTVVVDGLFLTLTRRLLPNGVVALLHGVPDLSPWAASPVPAIVTSQPTATAVAASASRVEIVRPGLDACFRPAPRQPTPSRRRIVCIGTVWPGKGQLLLARALAASPQASRCDLVLLGDHGVTPDYVRTVAAAAAPCALHLRGVCTPAEVAAELQRADLCVSASREESFGMAVAEALACATPVLAFATGEIPTLIYDGINGWLVAPAATDAAFRLRLHELLADDDQLAAARAAATAPPLGSWDDAADHFAAACQRLTGG
jgi:glycosyltransferase involved in cell wall biosynthesis